MSEQHEWVYQPIVYIRGTPEEINDYRRRFGDVCHAYGKGPSTTAGKLFLLALDMAEKDPDILNKLDTAFIAVAKRYVEIGKRNQDLKKMRSIFEADYSNDPEGFTTWCQDNSVPPSVCDQVLDTYRAEIPTWRKRATEWLCDVVLADGELHATDKIREMAISASIISTTQQEWDKLRQLAWRERLTTNEKGQWQKTL